jgi:hypothetical protein
MYSIRGRWSTMRSGLETGRIWRQREFAFRRFVNYRSGQVVGSLLVLDSAADLEIVICEFPVRAEDMGCDPLL